MGGHIQRAVRALSFDDMSISWCGVSSGLCSGDRGGSGKEEIARTREEGEAVPWAADSRGFGWRKD